MIVMAKKEVKKEHVSLYGRSQFEYLIVCLLVFLILAVTTTSIVWGSGAGNTRTNPSVSGSGFLSETITSVGEHRDTIIKVAKVSFGGKAILGSDGTISGNWHLKLFDVKPDEFDNSEFRATQITSLTFNTSACGKSAHLEANGKFNGKLGAIMKLDMSEGTDTSFMRVRIYYPPEALNYDSVYDFTQADGCEGQTLVDSGHLTINLS